MLWMFKGNKKVAHHHHFFHHWRHWQLHLPRVTCSWTTAIQLRPVNISWRDPARKIDRARLNRCPSLQTAKFATAISTDWKRWVNTTKQLTVCSPATPVSKRSRLDRTLSDILVSTLVTNPTHASSAARHSLVKITSRITRPNTHSNAAPARNDTPTTAR